MEQYILVYGEYEVKLKKPQTRNQVIGFFSFTTYIIHILYRLVQKACKTRALSGNTMISGFKLPVCLDSVF